MTKCLRVNKSEWRFCLFVIIINNYIKKNLHLLKNENKYFDVFHILHFCIINHLKNIHPMEMTNSQKLINQM